MDKIELQRAFGALRPSWCEDFDPSTPGVTKGLHLAAGVRHSVIKIAAGLADKRAEIDADPHLNDAGKADARGKAAEALLTKLAGASEPLKQITARRDSLASQVVPDDLSASPSSVGLIGAVWGLLPKDPLLVSAMYETAIAEGDQMTAVAIEKLPRIHGGRLTDKQIQGGQARRAAHTHPAEAKELANFNTALADTTAALVITTAMVKEFGEAEPEPTIAVHQAGRVVEVPARTNGEIA